MLVATTNSDPPAILEQPPNIQRPTALHVPKNRATVSKSSSTASLHVDNSEALKRLSIEGTVADPYDTRCVLPLGGVHKIRESRWQHAK